MKPTVGRQVHYVSRGSADGRFPATCRTATITEVGAWQTFSTVGPDQPKVEDGDLRTLHQTWKSDACGLEVHNPSGLFFHPSEAGGVDYDGGGPYGTDNLATSLCDGLNYRPGTWHWPGRVTEEATG